jgi:hypothetical protein
MDYSPLLLSPADRYRFNLLYLEHTNEEMAIIFNTKSQNITATAKKLGVYDENKKISISRLK